MAYLESCGKPDDGERVKNRQSTRRPGHDYAAPGHYYVTLCIRNREPLLGMVEGETVTLSEMGSVVREELQNLPMRFPLARLDAFTIMPNHVHAIITLVGAPLAGARPVGQTSRVDRGDIETTRSGSSMARAGASPAPTATIPADLQ